MAFVLLLPSAGLAKEACHKIGYLADDYDVCAFDPASADIRIYNADKDGDPYGGFAPLAKDLWRRDKRIIQFAINGGMYRPDLSPVGLLVEDGVEKSPINTNKGWGNFHLLPNGVFYIHGASAGVLETHAFLASGIAPDYATQSGPMLVIKGKVHPAFLPHSDSLKIRNGVGIDDNGQVVFASSQGPVSFYNFAVFFRDVLNCRNALFLDGSISSLWIPEWDRRDWFFPLGTIIAVTYSLP
jgi:uncharacterized protein YigE (DUF2233 family)